MIVYLHPGHVCHGVSDASVNFTTEWEKDGSAHRRDAPFLLAVLAFKLTKNGGWKDWALWFLGHLCLLLSVVIFMPMGLHGHHDASAWAPHRHSQITGPFLPHTLSAIISVSCPADMLFCFSLFSHKLFYAPYVYIGCMLKTTQGDGSRNEEEVIAETEKEKGENTRFSS